MQDAMLMTYKALKEDERLNNIVKGIYNNPAAPDKSIFPRITMFEISNKDADYADNQPQSNIIISRIDIWSRANNIFEITRNVKRILKSTFRICIIEPQSDMYETDATGKVEIYHKPINVTIKIEQ